jgi:hypothetical protein
MKLREGSVLCHFGGDARPRSTTGVAIWATEALGTIHSRAAGFIGRLKLGDGDRRGRELLDPVDLLSRCIRDHDKLFTTELTGITEAAGTASGPPPRFARRLM